MVLLLAADVRRSLLVATHDWQVRSELESPASLLCPHALHCRLSDGSFAVEPDTESQRIRERVTDTAGQTQITRLREREVGRVSRRDGQYRTERKNEREMYALSYLSGASAGIWTGDRFPPRRRRIGRRRSVQLVCGLCCLTIMSTRCNKSEP